uniref:SUN domain-containing protein n=1 Tax=Electrophorus electricus TaxID=8005 RepID=A0A4W4FA78_ELEEL
CRAQFESDEEMSRRSARLKTSGYYPQDDDTASTCSNGSASPISYKESPFRVFKKKAANRKLVGSSRTSSHASSLSSSQGPYTSELITEDEFTGQSRAFALLYWWLGPAWYSLTSGISLLDVFLLSRVTAGQTLHTFIGLLFIGYLLCPRTHTVLYFSPVPTISTFCLSLCLSCSLWHPLQDHVLDARLSAMKVEIYASLREQEMKWFENSAREMESMLKDMDDSVNFDQEVVMRPDLERELEALEKKIIDRLRQQQDKEKRDVWRVVGETLQEEGMGAVAIKEIEHIVHRALSLFRADGTGMADYALESSGASVINTRCSETYRTRSACLSLFGIPLWYHSENPRAVIQPEVYPGKCWAFRGSEGFLVISLSYPVRITHITLEHIPRNLSPTGHIDSAPKDFTVYGMTHEHEEGKLLGSFTYDQDGEPIQTYQVPESPSEVYHLVELRVLSNWGHPEYTCLYRFRVHGLPWSTSQEERRTRESINE